MDGPLNAKHLFLGLIAVLLVVIGVLPVLYMLFGSVFVNGHFSLDAYAQLANAREWTLMGHSFALASLVTVLTVVVGVPLGVLFAKTDLIFSRFFTVLFVIPLLLPPYIIAVSWSDLWGMGSGYSILIHASRALFGLWGCVFVLFSTFLPIPMLMTMVFLRTINPRMEEAARLVSKWPNVLRHITIPMIMPGILLSAILVFLLSFGEFGVPNFLRYDVFPVESFTQFSAFYNFKAATAATIPLVAITLIVIMAEAAFLRDKTFQPHAFAGKDMTIIRLRSGRVFLSILVGVIGLIIVVVPLTVLIIQSGTFAVYAEAIKRAGDSLQRSLVYAIIGACLLSFFGFFTGYLIHTKAVRSWRVIDSITLFLFALPGTVVGIGLITMWNTPWTNFIYATPVIIIFGYLARYTVITSRITLTQLARIPPSMEEAAQVAGAGWFRRMMLITIPMAKRGILAGWLAGYIFSLRDTGVTMLIYPAGHDTLPVRIFTLMANGTPQLIAALCVLMIMVTLVPAGSVWLVMNLISKEEL